MSAHRSLKSKMAVQKMTPRDTHANQTRASARKRARQAEREQAEQAEATARGITLTQLRTEKYGAVRDIVYWQRQQQEEERRHQTRSLPSYW